MRIFSRVFLLTTAAAALAACNDQPAPVKVEIRPIRSVVVDPAPIADERQAVGEIRPRQETDLGFQVSGKLVSRKAEIGGMVAQGDELAKLDEQDFLNRQKSADADVAAAEAANDEAGLAFERQKKLLESGNTTRANYDLAVKNRTSAEAKLNSARAAAALAKDQFDYTTLHAEFDGVVTGVGAEAGQVVNVGQMIVRVAKPGEKDAVFAVSESAFRGFTPDDRPIVLVALLSDPNVTAEGTVREVSPVADAATRAYQVKVSLENPPPEMRFGASVSGRLKTTTEPVVVLPGASLYDQSGKPAVWIYDKNSQSVALRPVTVVSYDNDQVVIGTGLAKGDVVVTAGAHHLREGQKVKLLEETQP